MIWFDLVTPKSVLFFEPIIKKIKEQDIDIFITTRGGEGYKETIELLDLYNLPYTNIGNFGGSSLKSKFEASIDRQIKFMEFIGEHHIDRLVCLSSVDACRVAFGLGIPIINFYDIPLSDYTTNFTRALPQARLTIPLAKKMFRPFVVPDEVIERFGLDSSQIHEYNFIDPLIWLRNFKYDLNYVKKILKDYDIDYSKSTIVIREEEYKSCYVDKKYPILYEAIDEIQDLTNANIILIPRYESEYLEKEFPNTIVLKEKVEIQHLLVFCDLFIGGGGTINSEACFLGTPTISTRSFISHYDKYQIDNNLMVWVETKEELIKKVQLMIGTKVDTKPIKQMSIDIDNIIKEILD